MSEFHLEHRDEYPHSPDSSSIFNESVYANAFDPAQKVGGWMRLGNRVNEGYAELSVCLYLPDGRIACQFGRPKITSNERFAAGGLSWDIRAPFERFQMDYDGDVLIVEDPEWLREPEVGLKKAAKLPASVRWSLSAVSPIHGGRPTRDDQQTMYGRDFSLNHFNQHMDISGEIAVGDQRWTLRAHGWRDHSWGPRIWQVIHSYRLFMANFGDGYGLMLLRIADKSGRSRRLGVLMVDHEYQEVVDLDVTTRWNSKRDPVSADIAVRTAQGTAEIRAQIVTMAPLRNRRKAGDDVLVSRIWEGATRFSWGSRTTLGMSEYIERLDEGRLPGEPV